MDPIPLAASPHGRGARRIELHVGPAVPGGEIITFLEVMEKLGYSYEIRRQKP